MSNTELAHYRYFDSAKVMNGQGEKLTSLFSSPQLLSAEVGPVACGNGSAQLVLRTRWRSTRLPEARLP